MGNSALSIPSSETQSSTPSIFTDQEKDLLRQLPHREYLLDEHETQTAMLNLLDILLAFTYDLRTTLGEHTVESGWTISRVSAVFSSADSFSTLDDVIRAFLCIATGSCLSKSSMMLPISSNTANVSS